MAAQSWRVLVNALGRSRPELNPIQLRERDETETERIIRVVRVVGDRIDLIHHLRFEQRAAGAAKLRALWGIHPLAMGYECLAHLERQIQAGELRIAFFELIDP